MASALVGVNVVRPVGAPCDASGAPARVGGRVAAPRRWTGGTGEPAAMRAAGLATLTV